MINPSCRALLNFSPFKHIWCSVPYAIWEQQRTSQKSNTKCCQLQVKILKYFLISCSLCSVPALSQCKWWESWFYHWSRWAFCKPLRISTLLFSSEKIEPHLQLLQLCLFFLPLSPSTPLSLTSRISALLTSSRIPGWREAIAATNQTKILSKSLQTM